MGEQDIRNIIVIGSGPAGDTAAIYSARANLAPLMVEGALTGGQLMITTDVENYPGFPEGIMGPELMDLLHKQAGRFGTDFVTEDVTEVDFKNQPFTVKTASDTYRARSVIIATGATARWLDLPEVESLRGRGLSACATCDGAFYRDQHVLVVGGGDSAMEEAIFLTRFASKVTVVHRREELRASKIMGQRAKENPKIEFALSRTITKVNSDASGVSGAVLGSTSGGEDQEVACTGIFFAIGHVPNTQLFQGQLELDPTGYIVTKADSTYTSVDGVFACGDVQDSVYRQAITAAGSGCMAAIDAERWLEKQGA